MFERSITELDEEITALSTIRSLLKDHISELLSKAQVQLWIDWLNESSVLPLAKALSYPQGRCGRAAHVIPFGAWDEGWLPLHGWVNGSDRFTFRRNTLKDDYALCGWLEEHLNYWEWDTGSSGSVNRVDLPMPVQYRSATGVNG